MNYQPRLLPFVKAYLKDNRGSWPYISEGSGVAYRTVQNLARGRTSDPGIETVERIYQFMLEEQQRAKQAPDLPELPAVANA